MIQLNHRIILCVLGRIFQNHYKTTLANEIKTVNDKLKKIKLNTV